MTWQELKNFVNSLDPKILKNDVLIFPFCNGQMEVANLATFVGQTDLDGHCSDISNGYSKIGEPYIICGYE